MLENALQNRVSELFSLIRFLRVDPYSYYFSRDQTCMSLNWDMGPDGKTCEHCGRLRVCLCVYVCVCVCVYV